MKNVYVNNKEEMREVCGFYNFTPTDYDWWFPTWMSIKEWRLDFPNEDKCITFQEWKAENKRKIECNEIYYVFVEWGRFPTREHTLESAKKEAERLCRLEKRNTHIISKHGWYKCEAVYFDK